MKGTGWYESSVSAAGEREAQPLRERELMDRKFLRRPAIVASEKEQ